MARINSNITSLIAQANLSRANEDLEVRLERLATGVRINRGRDDPAGLIIAQRLRNDVEAVNQAIKNAERASSVIATSEGSLSEVNSLLNSVRSLIVEAANTGAFSPEERDANQRQIDSAIDSITRIANTASFGGLKLLNGSLDYQLSGVTTSQVSKVLVNNATFLNQASIQVDIDVVGSAQTGTLFFAGMPANTGTINETLKLEVAGQDGVSVLQFESGTPLSSVVKGINAQTGFTGVKAQLINATDPTSGMMIQSADYGSEAFASVTRLNAPSPDGFKTLKFPDSGKFPDISGGFPWTDVTLTTAKRDDGRDVSALVNGNLARGRGLELNVNTSGLGMELLINESVAIDPSLATATFDITGGGSLFQIGPEITPQQQTNIGVQSVAASKIGGTLVNGTLSFLSALKSGQGVSIQENIENGNDFTNAQKILDTAIDEVSLLRGRLGAFERNVLQTSVRSMQTAFENLSASESRIRDADFAEETSKLTRAQILTTAGISVLSLANQQSQQVLQLLG